MPADEFPLTRVSDNASSEVDSAESDGEDGQARNVLGGYSLKQASARSRIRNMMNQARNHKRLQAKCTQHIVLAVSVGFWVAVFGLPMYNLAVYYQLFGQRGSVITEVRLQLNRTGSDTQDTFTVEKFRLTCSQSNTGRMRNFAPNDTLPSLVPWTSKMDAWNHHNINDVWCGWLPQGFLSYWPNIAQLIIFTVYRNIGTTVNLAWQGIAGTALASINIRIMMFIYPYGARGHNCISGHMAREEYTVIWCTVNLVAHWESSAQTDLDSARKVFQNCDHGGLRVRAIFGPSGQLLDGWFSPGWRETAMAEYERLGGEECRQGSIVHDDPNYSQWVALLDVIFVLFLFLISKSARNTIMFGMVWHVCFMMSFMNPAIGVKHTEGWNDFLSSDACIVFVTTLLGAAIAVVATFIPCLPLCNLRGLYDDSVAITGAIQRVWADAVQYLMGPQHSAKSFQIETRIDAIDGLYDTVSQNIEGAWWETFDQGTGGKTRRLLNEFDSNVVDINLMLYALKACVLSEDFQGAHARFTAKMKASVDDLRSCAQDLVWLCLSACRDGQIEEAEVVQIKEHLARVQSRQLELLSAFHDALPDVSQDLADENCFVFSLSFWARKTTDFAQHIVDRSEDQDRCEDCRLLYSSLWEGIVGTWHPRKIFQHDHVMFCARNLASISLCFIIGCWGHGSIFQRYDVTMASTLTLLIVGDGAHLVDLHKNGHRLLGVALGKVLPILFASALYYFPCRSIIRFSLQAVLIWAYVTVFTFIYFASPMWNYVGCLIAAFGVYQLMQPCSGNLEDTFQARYREIGTVTVALFVQIITHNILTWHYPRELLVNSLRKLGAAFIRGYEAFFDEDLSAMQAAAREAAAQLTLAKALAPECDPKLKLVQCRGAPFKLDLCISALGNLELLLSDLNLLIAGVKDWVPNEMVLGEEGDEETGEELAPSSVFSLLTSRPAIHDVKQDLLPSVKLVMGFLPEMLENESEDCAHVAFREPEAVRAAMNLEGTEDLYNQLAGARDYRGQEKRELTNDLRVRLTIAVRALENSAYHLFKIEERCIKEHTGV